MKKFVTSRPVVSITVQLFSVDPFGERLHTEVAEVTGVNFSCGSQHSLSVTTLVHTPKGPLSHSDVVCRET